MMENAPLVDKEGYMNLPQGPGWGVGINKELRPQPMRAAALWGAGMPGPWPLALRRSVGRIKYGRW